MRKVYQLQLPAGVQPGSRAADYISTYQKGRYQLWELAMTEAQQALELDRADYEARRELAIDLAETLRQEIADTQDAIDKLRAGEIDRRQAIEQRRAATANATNRFNASAINRFAISTAPTVSSSTSTTTPLGGPQAQAPAGPLPLPPAPIEAKARGEVDQRLLDATAAFARTAGDFTTASTQADVVAAIEKAQADYAASSLGRLAGQQGFDDQIVRYLITDAIAERAAPQMGMSTPDILKASLRAQPGQVPTPFQSAYEDQIRTIYEFDKQGSTSSRTPTQSQRTTTSQRQISGGPALVSPELEGLVDDGGLRADLEARLQALDAELQAIEMPEFERRSIIDEARQTYIRNFGYDRPRTPQAAADARLRRRGTPRPSYSSDDVAALRQRLEAEGIDAVRASFQAPEQAGPTVLGGPPSGFRSWGEAAGFGHLEPPDLSEVDREVLGMEEEGKPETPPTRTQQDAAARQRAMVNGKALSDNDKEFSSMQRTAVGRLVQQLYAAGKGADLTGLEDQLIAAYDGDDQVQALSMLHALRTRGIESTMAQDASASET